MLDKLILGNSAHKWIYVLVSSPEKQNQYDGCIDIERELERIRLHGYGDWQVLDLQGE